MKKQNKTENINIRATKKLRVWLRKKGLSPTKIFNRVLEENYGWKP